MMAVVVVMAMIAVHRRELKLWADDVNDES
jgi:hypothetical protein